VNSFGSCGVAKPGVLLLAGARRRAIHGRRERAGLLRSVAHDRLGADRRAGPCLPRVQRKHSIAWSRNISKPPVASGRNGGGRGARHVALAAFPKPFRPIQRRELESVLDGVGGGESTLGQELRQDLSREGRIESQGGEKIDSEALARGQGAHQRCSLPAISDHQDGLKGCWRSQACPTLGGTPSPRGQAAAYRRRGADGI